jgi:CheY-like chemotaxis protein
VNRRILLIDADPAFRASLAQVLERYRFEIAADPDAEQALALASAAPPALLVVSVEEPDKAGFKVFQRCKKGALAKVPIVLVTSSVAPDSFAKHRSLKVHADEYIDKRSMSGEELLGKIDTLIGLGEPTDDDDLGMSLDGDEIPLSSDDMVLEETVGEDDAEAGDAEQHVDSMVDAETDAAFAALLGDMAPSEPAAVQAPAPAPPQRTKTPTLTPPPPPPPPPSREAPAAGIAAVPMIQDPGQDGGRPQESGGVEFDSFTRESMHAPVDLIAHARQEHRDHVAGVAGAHGSVPATAIDDPDLEPVEDLVAAAPDPMPEQQPLPEAKASKPRFLDVSTVVEPRLHAVAVVQAPAPSSSASAVPDLGLDEIAMPQTAAEQSGVYDRRALRKIGELERQITQLKTELDRARATADASARGSNREREFLNLREQIIARDKDLHRVRDDLRARDRDLADVQDRLRDAEQARTTLEARAAELAQQAAAEANRAVALEGRGKAQGTQLAALQQVLEARTHAEAAAEAARVQLERDLAEERALRAASASDAERSLRIEREQLVARHQAELAAVYDEAAAAREAALHALREELESDHAVAVAIATADARTEIATQVDHTVSRLEAKHGAELARRKDEHDAAIAQLTHERDLAMARIASERDAAVSAVEDEHHQLIARLQTERAAELAKVRDGAALQLSRLHDELTRELAQVTQDAEIRIAEATTARDRAVAELGAELERVRHQLTAARADRDDFLSATAADRTAALDELASLHQEELARREQAHAAARAQDAAAHDAAIASLRAELERQAAHHGEMLEAARRQLDGRIEQHEHAKGALIEQHRNTLDELTQRHAADLAQAREDKQRALEHEAAEHRAALLGAKRAMDEATARHRSEREAAERAAARALEDQEAQHERALASLHGEVLKTKATADAEQSRSIAAIHAEHERQRKEAHAQHTKLVGELTTERDELRRGLSSAREGAKRGEAELASAAQTIAERNAELRAHAAAIAERDQRITELRHELEALEQENANYQEQVLRAYQKMKTDEAMVARAKKAMAIALTVLDDQGNPKTEPT